jgi:hypothetical protein
MRGRQGWLTRRVARPPDGWVPASRIEAYSAQFDACDRLEALAMNAVRDRAGRYNNNENAIVKLEVSRALQTFDALLCLADAGYGAPALALGRTLIEEVVASWWLRRVSKQQVVNLLEGHEKSFSLILQGPTMPEVNYLPVLNGLAPMSAEDVESAREAFAIDPNLGTRHWTRMTVKKMAIGARTSMRPVEQQTLEALTGKPLLVANLLTHSSPLSLGARLVPEETRRTDIGRQTSRRPSTALVHETLAVGYESMALIAWLVCEHVDRSALDAEIQQGRQELLVSPPSLHLAPNEPCHCGSGRKYRHCHGRPGAAEDAGFGRHGWLP